MKPETPQTGGKYIETVMYSRIFRIGLCFLIAISAADRLPVRESSRTRFTTCPVLGRHSFTRCKLSSRRVIHLELVKHRIDDPLSPDQVVDYGKIEYLPISLEECIQNALADSKVFRDLGGAIIFAPVTAETTLDPALIYSNPIFGEDAALSAFDAQFAQSVYLREKRSSV